MMNNNCCSSVFGAILPLFFYVIFMILNLFCFSAKGIRRPLFAIYRRVLRMYDRKNYVGKYSSEEVQQLKTLKEKHGNDWATIGAAMGRSASSVKDRFRLMRDHCRSGLSN